MIAGYRHDHRYLCQLAYVMMERLYITPFGNRLPNLTFEVET